MSVSAPVPEEIWQACASHPPLERVEVMRLVRDAQRGDAESLQKVILHNLRYAVQMAKHYAERLPGAEMDDLIGAATVGLIEAVRDFDTGNGAAFLTYARWHVLKHIQKYIRDKYQTVKVSVRAYSKFRNGWAMGASTVDDAETIRLASNAVKAALPVLTPVDLSGNTFGDVGSGGRGTLGGFSATPIDDERRNMMLRVIEDLQPRYRVVMVMRVYDELTSGQIARELGVTHQAVSGIEHYAVAAMKAKLRAIGVLDGSSDA
jgi:RNA polymerase sigma factor (sigma-70 family)